MIEIKNISKCFSGGVIKKRKIQAVDNVSMKICSGKTVGIAGNSGCGKSTLARIILHLIPADKGTMYFEGKDVTALSGRELKAYRRKVQIIFQHPESALDPSKTILKSMLEPMEIHKLYGKSGQMNKIREVFSLVGLNERLLTRYPHQISGGEAQRVMIARALTLEPKLLILDEPTSMLDVSIQAHVMNLLKQLQKSLGLTYLFISHDLEVIEWFCDEVAVMNEGKIVEQGSIGEILKNPSMPFTKKLIGDFTL